MKFCHKRRPFDLKLMGPNHAAHQCTVAFSVASAYAIAATYLPPMQFQLAGLATVLVACGIVKIPAASAHYSFSKKITKTGLTWLLINDFHQQCTQPEHCNDFLLGKGFIWEPSHRQDVSSFIAADCHDIFEQAVQRRAKHNYLRKRGIKALQHPFETWNCLQALQQRITQEQGTKWLHPLGKEKDLWIKSKDLEGHTAVFGTTGSGKSRYLEYLITQRIIRGETVFVVDPKGDKGLEQTMQRMCQLCRRDRDFAKFHLGFPEESIHLNLLANYNNLDEIPSRIVSTLPGQGGEGQVFIEMGRAVLSTICKGLEMMGLKPSFRRLHHFYHNRIELAEKALKCYIALQKDPDTVKSLESAGNRTSPYEQLKQYYLARLPNNEAIDEILAFAERDPNNLLSTTASTINLVSQLSMGVIGDLLALNETGSTNEQVVMDTRTLINKKAVVYIGLSAMTDPALARAVGAMFLADLTASAGERYNYESESTSVSLFIDEAGELTCEPCTQLLNKSRGAKFSLVLATQTVSDFVRYAGNRDNMMRILANLNNYIVLRTPDPGTQDFLMRRIPKTIVKTTQRAHGVSTSAHTLTAQAGNVSEREVEQEVELVPKELLGSLPSGEFFGIVSGGHVIKGRVPLLLEKASDFQES